MGKTVRPGSHRLNGPAMIAVRNVAARGRGQLVMDAGRFVELRVDDLGDIRDGCRRCNEFLL